MMNLSEQDIERFWSKVDKAGDCWLWTASRTKGNRGQFALRPGVTLKAHRVAWWLQHGEIPEGMSVSYTCDTPWCVRHLVLKSTSEAQNHTRGTGRRRDSRPALNVASRWVEFIQSAHAQGVGLADLCRVSGLGPETVQLVIRNEVRA